MPRIKETSIQEVLARADIVDVVKPYVTLKRSGSKWRGLSPFNPEKSPSFYVTPDKNAYYCFSSGQGGGVVSFVQKMQNLTYPESIEFLASRYNINLEYEISSAKAGEAMSLKRELLNIHEYAASWFAQNFKSETNDGQFIREYWTNQRNFSIQMADDFQIGYAPASPETALSQYLQSNKFSRQAMEESGLFYFERNGQWVSRFQGRLMIPIRDIQGRVIAFTARQTKKTPTNDKTHAAKYINSPETPIFHKGKILFGLHHARQHIKNHDENFLLVEGQLDAMRCWQMGLNHAVAPQGTALTEDQLFLLKRYSPNAIHCFLDGDSAGQKAGYRIIPLCIKLGFDLYFLKLESGIDPDAFLQGNGFEGFENLLTQKKGAMEFASEFLNPEDGFHTPQQKTTGLEELFEMFQEANSITVQDGYLTQASQLLKLDEAAVRRDYATFQKRRTSIEGTQDLSANNNKEILTNANFDILSLILLHPEHGENIAAQLDPEWIDPQAPYSSFLRKVLIEIREGVWMPGDNPDNLLETEDEQNLYYRISTLKTQREPEAKATECLNTVQRQFLKQKEIAITENMSTSIDQLEKLRSLQKERNEIRRLLNNLKQPEGR